ncbi:MAG: nuclear transport factor 2 family protein [Defluviicoccus sp.]|nr:nuclear transport factor 2 family protein [Defluviicoccus sp.]
MKIVKNKSGQRVEEILRDPMPAETDPELACRKLIAKFEEGFTRQDLKTIADCLLPSFEWRMPNGEVAYGRENALAAMEMRFAMPNGPKFSRSVWRFRGRTVIQTYRVEYPGPDGRWRKSRGLDLYKIRNGLIARKDAYWKMIP